MAQQVNLTQAFVAKLEPPNSGRATYRDTKANGLILVVTAAGTKSFYLYRWLNGKPSRVLLGHHPLLTVEAARDEAVKKYAEQLDGTDHNADKRTERKAGVTLGSVWKKYKEQRLEARSARSTIVTHESRWDTCLKCWEARRLDSIRREDVATLHANIGKERGHTTANRAVQLLRSLFNYAATAMDVELVNPAARIEMFREVPRERFLRADELPKFFAAVNAETDEVLRDFFFMAIWTGARRGNIQSMRWEHIDLEAETWTIPAEAFKTRRPMVVVLTPEALEVLKQRKAAKIVTEFVFPSFGKRGHLVEPKTAWARILERSGLQDLTIHDLRRTLGSWQAAGGSSLPIIGKSLGHTQASTTQIYARLDLEEVRASVGAATAAIKKASEKKEPQS